MSMNTKVKYIIYFILITCLIFIIVYGINKNREYSQEAKIEEKAISTEETVVIDTVSGNDTLIEIQDDAEIGKDELDVQDDKTDLIINAMSLEEKIYQLFILTPEQLTGVGNVTAAGATTEESIKKYPIGGLIYFKSNLIDKAQTVEMISNTQEIAKRVEGIPLFICVDEEGGTVVRIANNPKFGVKNVGDMSQVSDAQEVYECADTIGKYLSELGFNIDFAPVADVVEEGKTSIITKRSFGSDADQVTNCSIAYSNGLHENNVFSTFKHFPGHGIVENDTHNGYAYSNMDYEELASNSLKPFMVMNENNVDFVMVAHISLPNIIGDDTPSSLSSKMIKEILRNDIGYSGIVITDALNMGAISEHYTSKEAAVKAVQAGADLLLMPQNFHDAYDGIVEAVNKGDITEAQIDESLKRIIQAKLKLVN